MAQIAGTPALALLLGAVAWGGSHQELPIGGQQPRTVGLHLAVLFAQPKLHREPVQLARQPPGLAERQLRPAQLPPVTVVSGHPPHPGRAQPRSRGGHSMRTTLLDRSRGHTQDQRARPEPGSPEPPTSVLQGKEHTVDSFSISSSDAPRDARPMSCGGRRWLRQRKAQLTTAWAPM